MNPTLPVRVQQRRFRGIDAVVQSMRLRIVEEVPTERVIKYLPIGSYKWCVASDALCGLRVY